MGGGGIPTKGSYLSYYSPDPGVHMSMCVHACVHSDTVVLVLILILMFVYVRVCVCMCMCVCTWWGDGAWGHR